VTLHIECRLERDVVTNVVRDVRSPSQQQSLSSKTITTITAEVSKSVVVNDGQLRKCEFLTGDVDWCICHHGRRLILPQSVTTVVDEVDSYVMHWKPGSNVGKTGM
jgi:hypothetical protein